MISLSLSEAKWFRESNLYCTRYPKAAEWSIIVKGRVLSNLSLGLREWLSCHCFHLPAVSCANMCPSENLGTYMGWLSCPTAAICTELVQVCLLKLGITPPAPCVDIPLATKEKTCDSSSNRAVINSTLSYGDQGTHFLKLHMVQDHCIQNLNGLN